MSEHELKTYIGEDELDVVVSFDYEPSEKQTHDCPASDSMVTINSVSVILYPSSKNIIECLDNDCLEELSEQCKELIEKHKQGE